MFLFEIFKVDEEGRQTHIRSHHVCSNIINLELNINDSLHGIDTHGKSVTVSGLWYEFKWEPKQDNSICRCLDTTYCTMIKIMIGYNEHCSDKMPDCVTFTSSEHTKAKES